MKDNEALEIKDYKILPKVTSKLDVYFCRGCDCYFATETDKVKPVNCPCCLQQKDFVYTKTIEVSELENIS